MEEERVEVGVVEAHEVERGEKGEPEEEVLEEEEANEEMFA